MEAVVGFGASFRAGGSFIVPQGQTQPDLIITVLLLGLPGVCTEPQDRVGGMWEAAGGMLQECYNNAGRMLQG